MARDTGDESSEDEQTAEITTLETDFIKKFKERTQEANEVVNDWLAASKNYESATRITLFEQYRVMEDKIIEILNQNKKDSKEQSGPVREKMQERRGWIRDMWQKERENYKESVSMAICANMSLPFDEKLFKLRSKLKGVPLGYVETYQLSGINFSRALRELDKLYLENSDDQDALFEKLSSLKPVDLYNYDSIQEVLLTIRRIDNHCGAHKKNKAGEISMYTGIKKTQPPLQRLGYFAISGKSKSQL
jgi:HD-GYP domain-containing protein (c-di-GMP phosphodiesterase class II)